MSHEEGQQKVKANKEKVGPDSLQGGGGHLAETDIRDPEAMTLSRRNRLSRATVPVRGEGTMGGLPVEGGQNEKLSQRS